MTEPKKKEENFIDLYLEYTSKTECPTFFHRWCGLTALSAYLGRRTYFEFGHTNLYPNLYTMLIGSPGTKKSSAIKIAAKLIKLAGYTTFAAKKTRQEKFLLDLADQSERVALANAALSGSPEVSGQDILDVNLWGDGDLDMDSPDNYIHKPPAECFIAADEFNNFIGIGNIDFVSILGELWDYEGVYDYKLKNSKSVYIPDPTISILGGNTPTGFAQAFPTESIGQGFFSRLLLIYGEPSGVKYTLPPSPDQAIQTKLVNMLGKIGQLEGKVTMTPEAEDLLDKIYHSWSGIDDPRFEHYANRRLPHLIKLSLVITASHLADQITTDYLIEANTLLTFTEQLMPKALGEFGKARNSDITHKVMDAIDHAGLPITLQAIWKMVHNDLDSRNQLCEILGNLQVADKIQVAEGGYLPKKSVREEPVSGSIDWGTLTDDERGMI